MAKDQWLPRDSQLEGELRLQELVFDGGTFQLYALSRKGHRALFTRNETAKIWIETGLLEANHLKSFSFGPASFVYLLSDRRILAPLTQCPSPNQISEALSFAASLRRTRSIVGPNIALSEAIYVEKYSLLLPVPAIEEELPDDVVLGRYLTGGVEVSCNTRRRLKSLVLGFTDGDLDKVVSAAFIARPNGVVQSGTENVLNQSTAEKPSFSLAGRPQLESFFREHVIDIVEHPERYKPMGIEFPSAIVLHGPPGCGKTYAVERLVEYLDWPSFNIDSGAIGSKYIHETSRKVSDIFQKAIEQSPAVIVIDEMEAFLADRESGGEHRIEEVAEFLRRIPEAISRKVLIVAMTNRIDLIDSAILRRGRFDHVISVGMASKEEVLALLNKLLFEKPHDDDLDINSYAEKLTGRPLSDISFLVREAARLTARMAKKKIDKDALTAALAAVLDRDTEKKKPRIGFV